MKTWFAWTKLAKFYNQTKGQ
uniref:Uncharacterized protein n=1 Tax=Tetranychus urticae TaxID=32264 RepID=T1JSL0_TETUR